MPAHTQDTFIINTSCTHCKAIMFTMLYITIKCYIFIARLDKLREDFPKLFLIWTHTPSGEEDSPVQILPTMQTGKATLREDLSQPSLRFELTSLEHMYRQLQYKIPQRQWNNLGLPPSAAYQSPNKHFLTIFTFYRKIAANFSWT